MAVYLVTPESKTRPLLHHVSGRNLRQRAQYLCRLVAAAAPREQLRELNCPMQPAGGRVARMPVYGNRALHVTVLFQ
jgi:hypothetical protein